MSTEMPTQSQPEHALVEKQGSCLSSGTARLLSLRLFPCTMESIGALVSALQARPLEFPGATGAELDKPSSTKTQESRDRVHELHKVVHTYST